MDYASIGGSAGTEIRATINHHEYWLSREIFTQFDFGNTIKHILLQKVFGAGIHLYSDQKIIDLGEPQRVVFLDRWTTLGRKIFEEWYTLGVVPYRWRWNAEQEVMVPEILTETMGLTYHIDVITTSSDKRYEFYETNADKPDPTVLFLDDFNASPTMKGALTSPVSQLHDLYSAYILLNTLKYRAAGLKATPRIIAEIAEPVIPPAIQNSMPATQLFRQNLVLQSAAQRARSSGSDDILRQVQRQATLNQRRLNEAWDRSRQLGRSTTYREVLTQACSGASTVLTVHEGQKVTAAPPVSEPDQFVEHEKMLKQNMASALNVPYAIILGDTTSRTAVTATDLTLPAFIRTIVYIKMKMSTVLTDLFQEMSIRTRDRRIQNFRKRVARLRSKRRLEKEYVATEWANLDESNIKLTLIHNDIQDMERLAYLFVSGVLSYADFVHELLSNVPFNQTKRETLEQLAAGLKDPLTDEEKAELSKEYFGKLLGTSSAHASRAHDMETRDGVTSLSLGTRAKRRRTDSSSTVTEPTAANLH